MTPLETRRIENLRRAGWGYKNIAAFCGMSREAVRAYCLRENLEADPELVEQVCAWCGLALSGRSNSARFCCASCRWSAWNDKHQRTSDHARPCQACGKDFISAKKRQKYCSHSCYVRARFATKGGRAAQLSPTPATTKSTPSRRTRTIAGMSVTLRSTNATGLPGARSAPPMSPPLCEMCEKEERLTPVAEVHHILPLSHGGTHDKANLMSLCKPCHSRQTAKDDDRWKNTGSGPGQVYTY